MNPSDEEKQDPVWELLKEAKPPEVSPFFSRNVVREVRKLEAGRSESSGLAALFNWLSLSRPSQLALTASLAVALVLIAILQFKNPQDASNSATGPTVAAIPTVSDPPPSSVSPSSLEENYDPVNEIENIEYLGELMAITDPSVIQDSALADLLF